MPVPVSGAADPHEDWPDRTPLLDESGALLFVFSAGESTRDAMPWADGVWVPPSVPVARAVAAALEAMPGWHFSTSDPVLANAMKAAGATERRHAHTMTIALAVTELAVTEQAATVPAETTPKPQTAVGDRVRVEALTPAQVDRHALRLGALHLRAYPRDHPDAFDGDQAAAVSQVRAIARGEILGPLLAQSQVALVGGEIAGACLLVDRPGTPPGGGPWVVDIFRDPDIGVPGVGTALLAAVLVAARGAALPSVSLAVSHRNERARRLYERLGLVSVDESRTLALPGVGERPGSR